MWSRFAQHTSLRPLVSLASLKRQVVRAAPPRHSPISEEGGGAAGEEGQRQEIPGINETGWEADVEYRIPKDALSLVSILLPQGQRKVGGAWNWGERRQKPWLPL